MSSARAGWELSLSRLQQCIVGDGVGGRLNEERDALADLSSVSLLVEERVGEGRSYRRVRKQMRERDDHYTHTDTQTCATVSHRTLMSATQRLNTKERLQTYRTCSVSAEVVSEAQRGSAVRLSFYHVAFVMYVLCCVDKVPVQMSLHCC